MNLIMMWTVFIVVPIIGMRESLETLTAGSEGDASEMIPDEELNEQLTALNSKSDKILEKLAELRLQKDVDELPAGEPDEGCDKSESRCSNMGKGKSSKDCDAMFKKLIGYTEDEHGGFHDAAWCPAFFSKAQLNPVMQCYRTANSLNTNAKSYLEPGEPSSMTFSRSDGPLSFARNMAICCEEAGLWLHNYAGDATSKTLWSRLKKIPLKSTCEKTDGDSPEDIKAKSSLKTFCEVAADENIKQHRFVSHAEFVNGFEHELKALRPDGPTGTSIVHIMRMTSGGNDDTDKPDKFLWKSSLWVLALAWASLETNTDFAGVLLMPGDIYAGDTWEFGKGGDELHRDCKRPDVEYAMPSTFEMLLLSDVSYSGSEVVNTAEMVLEIPSEKNLADGKALYDVPTACTYVIGALYAAGSAYKKFNSNCAVKPGILRISHKETVANVLKSDARLPEQWIRDAMAQWFLENKRVGTELGWVQVGELDQGADEEPDFVVQHKIPDAVSLPFSDGWQELVRSKFTLPPYDDTDDDTKFATSFDEVRPHLAPYKKVVT